MKKVLGDGVFYTVGEDGNCTDKGIVDEMLVDEVRIREELIKAGVIKNLRSRDMTPEELDAFKRESEN
jgi:predicted metal-dependent phosphotriesterase family hydrolase